MIINIKKFPILLKAEIDVIFVGNESELKQFLNIKKNGVVILKNASNERLKISSILDSKGNLFEFQPVRKMRSWTSCISAIVDLVQLEVKPVFVEQMTTKKFRDYIDPWKGTESKRLKKYLSGLTDNLILESEVLQSWVVGR